MYYVVRVRVEVLKRVDPFCSGRPRSTARSGGLAVAIMALVLAGPLASMKAKLSQKTKYLPTAAIRCTKMDASRRCGQEDEESHPVGKNNQKGCN